jgi:uncharacterized metal-binding protein YceD (DUF177 family)
LPSFRKKTVATDYFQQFAIQFSGLADGDHDFAFEIGDQFFSGLEYSVVEGGDVKVDVLLHKQPNMITLNFDFEGEVKVMCDRCAGSVPYPVEGSQRLIIQLGDGEADDDELIILPRGEFEFNIAQHLYEYVALSLPLRLVPCEETGDTSMCDQSVLSRLDEIIVTEESSPVDPRWDKLKGLNTDN